MLVKHLVVTAALAVATTTSAGPAVANSAAAPRMTWTTDQLQALAKAYRAKNPDWRAPSSSGVHDPADLTWTSENLDRLANAYSARNPGWARPARTP